MTSISSDDLAGARREAAYRAALRHSGRVRLVRRLIPAAAIAGVLLFIGFAWLDPFRAPLPDISIDRTSIEGGRIIMDLPKLTGFNNDNRAYRVTAVKASQALNAPNVVDLVDLEAVVGMDDGKEATLTASAGQFRSAEERLSLSGDVGVVTTHGYEARLSEADIDFKSGVVRSGKPVTVVMTSGTVAAGGMTITEGGGIILFNQGVSARFTTRAADDQSAGTSQ